MLKRCGEGWDRNVGIGTLGREPSEKSWDQTLWGTEDFQRPGWAALEPSAIPACSQGGEGEARLGRAARAPGGYTDSASCRAQPSTSLTRAAVGASQ